MTNPDEIIAQAEQLVARLKNTPKVGVERVPAASESGTAGTVNGPGAAASASGADLSAEGRSTPPTFTPEDRVRFADGVAQFMGAATQDAKTALRLLEADGSEIVPHGEKNAPHIKTKSGELVPLSKEALTGMLPEILFPPAGVPGSGGRGGVSITPRLTRGLNAYDEWVSKGMDFAEFHRNRAAILKARGVR